jgi:hypothetical protein
MKCPLMSQVNFGAIYEPPLSDCLSIRLNGRHFTA